jgi:hypothetical protein
MISSLLLFSIMDLDMSLKPKKDWTPDDLRQDSIMVAISTLIPPSYIYTFLLPIIVLGEGFGAGHVSFLFTYTSVIKSTIKETLTIVWIALCAMFMKEYIVGLPGDGELPVLNNIIECMLVSAMLGANVVTEGLAPLEKHPNEKLHATHIKRTYLSNNMS